MPIRVLVNTGKQQAVHKVGIGASNSGGAGTGAALVKQAG
jgi:hypothetical protein